MRRTHATHQSRGQGDASRTCMDSRRDTASQLSTSSRNFRWSRTYSWTRAQHDSAALRSTASGPTGSFFSCQAEASATWQTPPATMPHGNTQTSARQLPHLCLDQHDAVPGGRGGGHVHIESVSIGQNTAERCAVSSARTTKGTTFESTALRAWYNVPPARGAATAAPRCASHCYEIDGMEEATSRRDATCRNAPSAVAEYRRYDTCSSTSLKNAVSSTS